ncbi:glycine-rich domain-containing protein, partial [uncultured Paracoccus sp.]|uniref:glycine-rich domain-containing protein n=1 Tax=uncultured Paracoccus sp. TaxID=189685 RepID=UPI00345846D2
MPPRYWHSRRTSRPSLMRLSRPMQAILWFWWCVMPDLDLPRIGAIAHMGQGVSQLAHLGAVVWGPRPIMTVTGGALSMFVRGGVNYTQIRWDVAGDFTLPASISGVCYALVGGGGTGGRGGSAASSPGGGGGGGVVTAVDAVLPSGTTTISVGAGGARDATLTNRPGVSGSPSALTGAVNLPADGGGGGGGGASGSFRDVQPGGCGGGAA